VQVAGDVGRVRIAGTQRNVRAMQPKVAGWLQTKKGKGLMMQRSLPSWEWGFEGPDVSTTPRLSTRGSQAGRRCPPTPDMDEIIQERERHRQELREIEGEKFSYFKKVEGPTEEERLKELELEMAMEDEDD